MAINRKLRKQVVSKRGIRCEYCNRLTVKYNLPTGSRIPDNAQTIDHIIPTSRGGTDTIDNLVVACGRCNQSKCDLMPITQKQWAGLMRHIVRVSYMQPTYLWM